MSEFADKPVGHPRRRAQRLAILGVVCLLLGAVAGPVAYHRLSIARPTDTGADDAPADVSYGQLRAIVLELHSGEPGEPYEQKLADIASAGAKAVCLSMPIWQEDTAASSVF